MDAALKQRLLGAAVLLALLVIFVPMFFPGPDDDAATNQTSLDMPAEPASSLDSHVFKLDVPPKESTGTTSVAGSGSVGPRQVEADDVQPALSPEQAQPAETHEAQPGETSTTSATSQAKAAEKPATTPSEPGPGTAAESRFAVSVGVFASSDNADTRLAKVKLLGYDAWVEHTQAGDTAARGVRVGPFDTRADAEAARLRLKQDLPGVDPSLVMTTHARSEDAPADALGADQAGSWAVQLAAFRKQADAKKLVAKIRDAGFDAFVDRASDSAGDWWRVRVGPRTQRADAETLKKAIQRKLGKDGLVVARP